MGVLDVVSLAILAILGAASSNVRNVVAPLREAGGSSA
jgi:hypothetical protein